MSTASSPKKMANRKFLNILLIESNEKNHRAIADALNQSVIDAKLDSVLSLAETTKIFTTHIFDIILLGSQNNSTATLRVIKKWRKVGITTPIIVLTERNDVRQAVQMIQAGANDVLVADEVGDYLEQLPDMIRQTHGRWIRQQRTTHQQRLSTTHQEASLTAKKRVEALAEIQMAITEPHELQVVLKQLVDITNAHLPTTSGASIVLTNDSDSRYANSSTNVAYQPPMSTGKLVRKQGGATRWIIDNQRPLVVSNTEDHPFATNQIIKKYNIRSFIGVPLLSDTQEVLGVLYALDNEPRDYSDADVEFMMDLAFRGSIVIQRVKVYELLRRANRKLDKHKKELEQQKVVLEERNSELDAFTHTVAHDLKAPLSLITGYSGVLPSMLKNEDEKITEIMGSISSAAVNMSNIIDELLLLASVRQEDVAMTSLDMAPIVNKALQRLEHMITKSNAQITIPDQWHIAVGYGPWLIEVWMNYLTNAIKYGGTPPKIVLGSGLDADGMVRFWVQDNGEKVLTHSVDDMFKPFNRLNQVRTKGHGLGLSIVRRIVEKCSGEVGFESREGRGSRFWFALAAEEPAEEFVAQPSDTTVG